MSTQDTDYTIVIKGKPPEARQAAADYITLLLNPWRPDRSDMKTQVKIEVFRNEMHSRGFLEPVELAKEAAEYFPGVLIAVEGKSESGYIEEEYQDEGTPPVAPFDLVVDKVLSKIVPITETDSYRHKWIEPMEEWSKGITLSKVSLKQIKDQFKITEAAAKKAEEERKQEEERSKIEKLEKEKEDAKRKFVFHEQLLWTYNPIASLEGKKIGALGDPLVQEELDWDGNPKDEPTYRILIPIVGGEKSKLTKFLTDAKKQKEAILKKMRNGGGYSASAVVGYVKSPKGVESVFGIYESSVIEEKGKEYWKYKEYISPADLESSKEMACVIANGSEFWINVGIDMDKLPSVSNSILCDPDWIYLTTSLPEGVFLQKLNHQGEMVLSVQTGMNSSWGLCMDDERIYITGGTGSEDHEPRCITAIGKEGSIVWRIELPIHPTRDFHKKDFCEIMAVSQEIFVYALKNDAPERQALVDPCNVVAINPNNGERLWDISINQHPTAMVMDGSRIYVTDASHIHSFDYQGMLLWSEKLPDVCKPQPYYPSEMAFDGEGNLVLNLAGKGIAKFACDDGKCHWRLEIEDVRSSCVIGLDRVSYLISGGNLDKVTRVYAIDSKSGKEIWKSEIEDTASVISPTLTSKGVLVVTCNRVSLLSLKNGAVIWTTGNELTFPTNRSMRLLITGGDQFLLNRSKSGNLVDNLPYSLCSLKGEYGTLSGSWPIAGGNGANSNYLATARKGGFKEFITEWKSGKPVAHRLARLNPDFKDESQIGSYVHGMIRGRELLKNAKEWTEPEIGQGPSATYRGLQWKLVMAYSGVELMVKSLTAMGKGGLGQVEVEALVSKLPLSALEPIASPSLDRKPIKAWLEELDQDAALDFLKTDKGDRIQIQSWLFDQKPCATWTDALLLAKALRNCTAHGALSPNKIQEWGLTEAFKQLPQALFKIDAAIFEMLGS